MLYVTLFIFSTETRRMRSCVSHGYEITSSKSCVGMKRGVKAAMGLRDEVGAND